MSTDAPLLKSSPISGIAAYGAVDEAVDADLLKTGPQGLSLSEVAERLKKFGPNELPEKADNKVLKFLKEFVQPMPLMIWLAIFIEVAEYYLDHKETSVMDATVLLVLQVLNVSIGFFEELKASEEIAALRASLKPEAMVIRAGRVERISAAEIVPGDRVVLAAGAAVPADCILAQEQPSIQADQSALTGESLPVTKKPGQEVKMGSTVTRGESEAIVTHTGASTVFGKTAAMINNVDAQPHFEVVLQQLLYNLVTSGIAICTIIFLYIQHTKGDSNIFDVLSFVVVLLVASIPVALRVVCTCTLAVGCKELAAEEAIVARLSAVEELAGMDILCSDKTGTLTLNKMVLQDDLPLFDEENANKEDVLRAAALATKWWEPAKDALDTLVLQAVNGQELTQQGYQQIDYVPFDPSTKRTEAKVRFPDGRLVGVMKGAPNVVLSLCDGNRNVVSQKAERITLQLAERGVRTLAVATCQPDDKFRLIGLLSFLDPPRPDTRLTVQKAEQLGVQVKMITGDHIAIARETCRVLDMGSNIQGVDDLPTLSIEEMSNADGAVASLGADYGHKFEACDGFAQVFPEHKYLIVEALRQRGHLVGMTGDGVNDAPALKRADVGIAVSGATHAAQAAADIVLTREGLSTIITAVLTSRKIFQRMKNFVIYRVACTQQLLLFFFVSCILFSPDEYNTDWDDYFTIPVLSLVSITILNDGTIISVAYDNVFASRAPEKWDLRSLYVVASSIGVTALLGSLLMLHGALSSGNHESTWRHLGLPELSMGQIQTLMYLKISLSDYASVFNSRCRGWMWERSPSAIVVFAALFAMLTATSLSLYRVPGAGMMAISPHLAFLTWVYVLVGAIFQDLAKVMTYGVLRRVGMIGDVEHADEESLKNFDEVRAQKKRLSVSGNV